MKLSSLPEEASRVLCDRNLSDSQDDVCGVKVPEYSLHMRRVSPPICDTRELFVGLMPSSSPILTFRVGPRHISPLLFVILMNSVTELCGEGETLREVIQTFVSYPKEFHCRWPKRAIS